MLSLLKFNNISPGIILFSLILFSCGGEKLKKPRVFEGYPEWMDTILVSQDKIIRSVEPGMTQDEVAEIENVKSTEGDSLCQYYEFKTDSGYVVTFSYRYEKNKLSEIEMTIFTENDQTGNETFNQLLNYYEARFSKPLIDKGIYVFSASTSSGSTAKISIEDRSELQKGVTHILVYYEE